MHPEMETDFSKWRLIFWPKSLVLGWWGEMHPPPKSAAASECGATGTVSYGKSASGLLHYVHKEVS